MRLMKFRLSSIVILIIVFGVIVAGPKTALSDDKVHRSSETATGNTMASSEPDIISSISFTGNTKFSDKQLLNAIKLNVGDELSWDIMGGAMERLVNFYRENGENLSVSPNVTHDGPTIVEFIIDENGTEGDTGPYEPDGAKKNKSMLRQP